MLLRSAATLVLLGAFTAFAQAQQSAEKKQTFEEALLQSRSALVLTGSHYSGAGAAVLNPAIEQARFVLLGEDHITREIPRFAAAVCAVMHADAYAVEAGPYAARFVNGVLRDPHRIQYMAERSKRYPNNMAFLDIAEENDLAAQCAESSRNKDFALWGLDQEFLNSSGTLLEAMAATNPGPRSRAAVTKAQSENQAAADMASSSGDFGKLFMLDAKDTDLQELQSAIDADGNDVARDLLHEFTISRRIYRLNGEGSPDSNLIRAQLLKQHFLSDYQPLKLHTPAPRILFKFGDNHTGKGFNDTHELNLGNFVAELAAGEQAQSLHILVLGARGMHFKMAGYGKPFEQQPFVLSDDPDYKWTADAVADLLPQQPNNSKATTLTLFDLRQLRYRGLKMSSQWERIVYSHDLFVFMPELSVASAIR